MHDRRVTEPGKVMRYISQVIVVGGFFLLISIISIDYKRYIYISIRHIWVV